MTVFTQHTARSSSQRSTLLSIIVASAIPFGLAVIVAVLNVVVGPSA
jgi:hypothetical protein